MHESRSRLEQKKNKQNKKQQLQDFFKRPANSIRLDTNVNVSYFLKN
jgi:hypothetical protein